MDSEQKLVIRENGIVLHFVKTQTNLRLVRACLESEYDSDFTVKNPDKYPYSQVHLAGGNRNGRRGIKATCAYESQAAILQDYTDERTAEGRQITVVSKTDKAEITSVFRFFSGIKTVQCVQSVKNISDKEICVEELDALYLYGIGGDKPALNKLNLYVPTNSWHVEAQWKKNSLNELYLFNGNDNESMKRVCVGNTGSWSTKEYLPMGILGNADNGGFMLWQIENNGSWHYEIGEHDGKLYLNVGGPDFENNSWAKVLKPGESFEGVAASLTFGKSLNDVVDEVTRYRRKIRRPNDDNVCMPVIFNSYMHAFWDYPTEEGLVPLIDAVSKLGCEYFCIDAGWFEGDDWWDKLGNYKESKKRFPGGVKKTIDYIKSKGMKAGLWVEIEDVGIGASIAALNETCYFRRNGAAVVNHDRLSLDFTQKEVLDRADGIIAQIVDLGAQYIKIDYNIDGGVGTDGHAQTLGDGLLQHNRAFFDWLQRLFEKYPDLVIENCASGGCRMDYKMLSLCSVQSTSDQTDYKKYPYISANILSAVCPEQAAVWSYPLRNIEPIDEPETLKDETIIMNMVNSMLGRIHLAGRLDRLSNRQLAFIKEGIDYYNEMKSVKAESVPYLPLGFTAFGADFATAGIRNDGKLYLAVWNLGGERVRKVPLPEINAKSVKVGYASSGNFGATLCYNELSLNFGEDYQARILEIDLASGDDYEI